MNTLNSYSDEYISAYIDGELDNEERNRWEKEAGTLIMVPLP